MKHLLKGIFSVIFFTITIHFVFGQKGFEDGSKYGHGEDSIRCCKNYSIYRENVKKENYDAIALRSWAIVYKECPKASIYIYIDGIKMIEDAIKKEKDETKKATLVDSMIRIYDKRIKYYGQKGYVQGKKGVDFIKYSESSIENIQIGYDLLKESIQLEKNNSGPAELLYFMQASCALFKSNSLEAGEVVANYGQISEIVDYIIKNKDKGWQNMEKAKTSIDQIFESCGAANCKDLIPFYAKKFKETPEDLEFLKKSTDLLRSTKCTDEKLFFQMADKLNSLSPTASLAYELANLANNKEKLEDAARYYKQAIKLETEDTQKAKYYLKLGDVTYRLGDLPQARTYALNSIELDPTSGYPYLLIGDIYIAASKSCGEEEFYQKAVYWAAVDKFVKAKTTDPELTEEANKYIKAYTARFPDNETIFFYGYKEGDPYTVGCWINEKTTVRAR